LQNFVGLMSRHSSKSLVLAIALILISGGSLHLQAQKSARTRSRTTKGAVPQKDSIVLARAGDSLKSIAERTGANATQLARLNGLSLNTKLKPGQRIIVPASLTSQPEMPESARTANGQLIKFVDGGSLHVDEAWWKGEEVWYRRGKVTETSARKVKSIEPVFVAQVEHRNNAETRPPIPISEKSPEASVSTWIYLVGGAKFKVDQVKESSDGAWYQRENLVSFLERSRIARIEREVPGTSPSDWTEGGWTSGSSAIDQSIRTNGRRFGVDPYLVFLVIEQESHFRTRVVSPKGARGLMQLMPGTARRFAVRNSFDAAENIRGGTQYLKELLTMFNGRVDLALASYNAGEGRVIGYGNKVPPFQETQNYVKRIGQRYKKGGGSQKDQRKAPTARAAQPALAEKRP
jgi:LysM repeat protein